MTDQLNPLARAIQRHVPEQPWGSSGNEPMPVQIWFNDRGGEKPWEVEFVLGLNRTGSKRRWGKATGATLEEALFKARSMQMRDEASTRREERA